MSTITEQIFIGTPPAPSPQSPPPPPEERNYPDGGWKDQHAQGCHFGNEEWRGPRTPDRTMPKAAPATEERKKCPAGAPCYVLFSLICKPWGLGFVEPSKLILRSILRTTVQARWVYERPDSPKPECPQKEEQNRDLGPKLALSCLV
jgi:hypothetical protein